MEELTENLIRGGYLKTPRIIEAMRSIDRRHFVRKENAAVAYLDEALPIGYGQTISQPLTVAFMLELLQPKEGNKILDVGSGSGWQSALLAHIVGPTGKVFAIELIPELKNFGEENAKIYSFNNLTFIEGNASGGLPEAAPFDRIIAAASGEAAPLAWKKQLKTGGRMVLPIGDSVFLYVKKGADEFEIKEYPGFAFVPLIDS